MQQLASWAGFGSMSQLGPRKTTDDGTTGLQTTDYGTWKSEARGQRSEVRGWRTEDRGQKTVTGIQ